MPREIGSGLPDGLNHRAIDGGSVRPLRQHEENPAAATAEAGCPRASKVGDGLAKTLKKGRDLLGVGRRTIRRVIHDKRLSTAIQRPDLVHADVPE